MADREAIQIKLGGKLRQLRIEFQELSLISSVFSKDPRALLNRLMSAEIVGDTIQYALQDDEALHQLLWACLHRDEPTIDMATVAELINDYCYAEEGNLGQLAKAVWDAWFVGGLGSVSLRAVEKNAVAEAAKPTPATAPQPQSANGSMSSVTPPIEPDSSRENGFDAPLASSTL